MFAHLTCLHGSEVPTIKAPRAVGACHPYRTRRNNIPSERPMGQRPPGSIGRQRRRIRQQPAIHCHSHCRKLHDVTRTSRYRFSQGLVAIRAVSAAPVSALSRQPGNGLRRAKYDQARPGLGGGPDVEARRHGRGVVETQASPRRRERHPECSTAERQREHVIAPPTRDRICRIQLARNWPVIFHPGACAQRSIGSVFSGD